MSFLELEKLSFIGPNDKRAELTFKPGVNLVYGASNTGKSLTLKALDFMFGKSGKLPDIAELVSYETIELAGNFDRQTNFVLTRAKKGGAAKVVVDDSTKTLSAIHDAKSFDNISQFFLTNLNLSGKMLATDSFGGKESLSFRSIIRMMIASEMDIQEERSPVMTGQHTGSVSEPSALRFFLTGIDDSHLIELIKAKNLRALKTNKIELIDEFLERLKYNLQGNIDLASLKKREEEINAEMEAIQDGLQEVEVHIQSVIDTRHHCSNDLSDALTRQAEIRIHLERFERLQTIYQSDIDRLTALEEAGFVLGTATGKPCPLCGAASSEQPHIHDDADLKEIRAACEAEIKKISDQSKQLFDTRNSLTQQASDLNETIPKLREKLSTLDKKLEDYNPQLLYYRRNLDEFLSDRDKIQHLLSLHEQITDLEKKKKEISSLKAAKKEEKPDLSIPGQIAYDFCVVVKSVLDAWRFPGSNDVSFDTTTLDLKINGKNRKDNGKGVRAVTHAAFKVALLVYCRSKGLPHPGLVILDTPLLTYRDPLKMVDKHGPLSNDEEALAKTSLKEHFFRHLHSLKDQGQFIIFENIDPPPGIESLAHVQAFSGDVTSGRAGLL